MFWIKLKRVIKNGWTNFRRNSLVSYAAVLVTTITLLVATGVFLMQALLNNTILQVESKVDIAVYFTIDAQEEKILALKTTLEDLPEVASIEYHSSDEQVLEFRQRHADDFLTLQALDELGDNPFGGSLLIKAKNPSQYETIAHVLEGDNQIARDNAQIIERINYSQNKLVIDRLNKMISNARDFGLTAVLVLSLISIIIVYTTIRLTIYMSREEIAIMRLVGASRAYVRAPFVVVGLLYGFFAFVISNAILLPILYFIGTRMSALLGFDVYNYYLSNFFYLGGIVLLIGLFLGSISSFLAVRRYLNV